MDDNQVLDQQAVEKIVDEIQDDSEVRRRALVKRRHDFYKDDSKKFLIEQLSREFNQDALKEFRLAPVNVMRKIVNKRSVVYKTPPVRKANSEQNQALVDYYVKNLSVDQVMQKANKYYNVSSNTVLYCIPYGDFLKLCVVPSYLYAITPSWKDPTKIIAYTFNAFTEGSSVTPQSDVMSATSAEGFSREPGYKTGKDIIASDEKESNTSRNYYIWTAKQQITASDKGEVVVLDPTKGIEQFENPIGILPVINIAKERDAESWSYMGTDLMDQCMTFQVGWTDLLTIAKHQGFSQPVITGEDEPKQLTFGVNRAIFLKARPDGVTPTVSFLNPNSPLDQYKSVLMEYLGLILTSNDMNPGSISGNDAPTDMASGFSRLIQMADALDAIESDKPVLRDAETEMWTVLSKWHNYMVDNGMMREETASLGKFTDDFNISIIYRDVRPLESEQERLSNVKALFDMGLITKKDALKKLDPDITDEQADSKLQEIEKEKILNIETFMNKNPQVINAEDTADGQEAS